MVRRKHGSASSRDRSHSHRTTTSSSGSISYRLPALLISFSSLLLSSGLATSLYVLTESIKDQLDGDLDQAGVVAWWTADAGFKWGLISSVGSLCGVIGILLHNSSLHRVFAVSTFADLLLTLLLTFTLSLLTLLPSLSPTFGTFLCSSVLASAYDSPSTLSTSRILHVERDTGRPGLGGSGGGSGSAGSSSSALMNDVWSWGVEDCEQSWKIGMYKVIIGCLVCVALRIYGVYVTWEHSTELRDGELSRFDDRSGGEACWIDEGVRPVTRRHSNSLGRRESTEMRQLLTSGGKNLDQESSHRRSASASSSRRSNTLPATGLPPRYSEESSSRPRSQSSSASSSSNGRPRLVLLPVYVDRHGNPIGSPSSGSSPPAYRTRSSTSPISPPPSAGSPRRSNSIQSTNARPPPLQRKRSPSLPRYSEDPLSLSPTSSPSVSASSGSTTPTCLSNAFPESSLNGRSRKTRHNRSDTDSCPTTSTSATLATSAVTSGFCHLSSSPTKLQVDNKPLPILT